MYAGGGTDIYVGLNAAYAALKARPDEVKTVILLERRIDADRGLSRRSTTSMIKAGINVSSIFGRRRSNRELMADIAMWGKGRAYYIDSYDRVPQIFIKETELALGKTLQEQPFLPVVQKNVEAFKGIDFARRPRLLGYVVDKSKTNVGSLAHRILDRRTAAGALAIRLGKAAAFTSDVKTRWAAEWIGWRGYPKFWSQVVRETMRRRSDEFFNLAVTRKNDSALVSLNAVDRTDGSAMN